MLISSMFSDGVAHAPPWRPSCTSSLTTARWPGGCTWCGAGPSLTPATGSPAQSSSISAARDSICQTRQTRCRSYSVRAACRWTHLWFLHASVSFISSWSVTTIHVSAMECEDTPDKGEDSGAAGYIWDDLKLYNKQINVSCPVGKVFKLIFFHSIKCQL